MDTQIMKIKKAIDEWIMKNGREPRAIILDFQEYEKLRVEIQEITLNDGTKIKYEPATIWGLPYYCFVESVVIVGPNQKE
jgi:hypothetical protein